MKALKTFVFLFISALVLSIEAQCQTIVGQNALPQAGISDNQNSDAEEPSQTLSNEVLIIKDRGLSIGIDVSPLIMRIANDERTGIAFLGRYAFTHRWFANAELGFEHIKYDKDTYDYKSNGSFLRIGVDYDLFNSEDYPTNDNIFVGVRYSYAWQRQESNAFTIIDGYWGDYTGSVGKTSVSTHSFDLLLGVRCEIIRNLYMGWSARGRIRAHTSDSELLPYAIPGYGKYDKRATIGFTYSIEYQIPFIKSHK